MEKVVFYRVYYYEDFREGKKYYYEDKPTCEIARFIAYKKYDKERLSTRHFVVPVSQVWSTLIEEKDIDKYQIYENPDKHADHDTLHPVMDGHDGMEIL